MKSSSPLELKPQPNVKKINRYVFFVLCVFIGIVIAVLAYSISRPSEINESKPDTLTPTSITETTDEQSWYKNASNALPVPHKISEEASYFSEDSETRKKQDDSLRAALDSSIKAPNISSNPITVLPHSEVSATSNSVSDYLHEIVKKPLSPYEVKSGTIIPAVLAGGINSDLPGQLSALVSQNVYDTVSGRYLLIPQGSKLILQYDSRVAYGQQRLLVAAKRLIFPNGNSLDLEGMPAVDAGGYSGFQDETDNHYMRIFGSSAIVGLITGGFALSQPQQGNNAMNPSTTQIMSEALAQQMGQTTLGMMNKNLDIQPTLKIRPGYEFNVMVTADLVFPGVYRN